MSYKLLGNNNNLSRELQSLFFSCINLTIFGSNVKYLSNEIDFFEDRKTVQKYLFTICFSKR